MSATDHPSPRERVEAAARDAFRKAVARLDEAELRGSAADLIHAHQRVAACYRSMGATTAAEESLRRALRAARGAGSAQLLVQVLCELAETACTLAEDRADDAALARAARDRARDQAFEASALVHRTIDSSWAADALLRISDALNRCGDHEDAAVLQARALESLGQA
jgi:tetratricopeptide (TPR) repeat protein